MINKIANDAQNVTHQLRRSVDATMCTVVTVEYIYAGNVWSTLILARPAMHIWELFTVDLCDNLLHCFCNFCSTGLVCGLYYMYHNCIACVLSLVCTILKTKQTVHLNWDQLVVQR